MTHSGLTPLTRDASTEGSLLVPKTIYNTLIEAAKKKLLGRELAAIYVGPNGVPGSSVDLNLVDADSMKVFRVAEGAVIPIDTPAYSSRNFKPVKYGVRPFITKEMIEDGKWDLLAHAIKVAGIEMAENENDLIETALGSAANTVAGGASVTIANLTRAMQYLEDSDYQPTDLIVGAEFLNDLRNIDTFVEANKFGSNEMLKTGFVGNIFGMKVWYVGSTWTTTTGYVLDRAHAFGIVEKRPLTVDRYNRLEDDMVGAVITTRIKVDYIRDSAICKITSS
jgi:HK97 family phage major capsid protein